MQTKYRSMTLVKNKKELLSPRGDKGSFSVREFRFSCFASERILLYPVLFILLFYAVFSLDKVQQRTEAHFRRE